MANLTNTKQSKIPEKITETLVCGYSSESTLWGLSNEYQHDRVYMVFKKYCVLVLWKNVASAVKGLKYTYQLNHSTDV